jgi:alditol oxidase
LQSEYFVPRERAVEAIGAVGELRDQITPHLLVSELRTITADELWMSPCFGRSSLGIHFTWKQDCPVVRKVLGLIERKLEPFEARPHWGKLFLMERERIQKLYPKVGGFRKLVERFDRTGKFKNEFLERVLAG